MRIPDRTLKINKLDHFRGNKFAKTQENHNNTKSFSSNIFLETN